jgi:hypothetical protein
MIQTESVATSRLLAHVVQILALYEWRVIHPEHVPEAICTPLAPDASASTLRLVFRAGCGPHLQVNELLHEEAYFPNHAPCCDDAAHGEV